MSYIFSNRESKIYIAKNQPECVKLAALDLVNDLKKIFGKAVFSDDYHTADIFIGDANSEIISEMLKEKIELKKSEEYLYKITDGKIFLLGADDLGVMWAIYSFIEDQLGVPPFYFFDDITIGRKEFLEIENQTVSSYPHTKFRGWFINDEDLLSGFKSKGKRNIDYIFYHDIIHPDMMEKIVETALRYKINLIIPSTLVDICNPDEENLVKLVSKRGLYVSQHHIEPMGVSHFGFADFVKKHGYPQARSFIDNRETMVACWKYYAEKWAKYPRIVWQLGLRGAGDKPVWVTDKTVGEDPSYRGKIISDAIAEQYKIISEVTKGEIYSTSTVWMEGAKLIQDGYLQLPQNTVAVFADIGMSQMFGDDFFTVPREADRKYGIYYHSQYWHTGPHLSEGVLPEKIDYNYNLARNHQTDYYAMLNVGNIKEFTFSIYINAKLAWHGDKTTLEQIIDDYCRAYANGYSEKFKENIERYYACMGDVGEEHYQNFCNKHNFNYHKYDNLPFPTSTINDGIICFVGRCLTFEQKNELYTEKFGKMIEQSYIAMCNVYEDFEKFDMLIDENVRSAYHQKWFYQAYYWRNLFGFALENCRALEEFRKGKTDDLAMHYERAGEFVKNILTAREKYYIGAWKNWFNDERKLDLRKLYDFCLAEKKRFENV